MNKKLKKIIDINRDCDYLKNYNLYSYDDFKKLPIINYDDLFYYINKIKSGEKDVLFKGIPLAVEKTSGTLGSKYIYYSKQGIEDLKVEIEKQYFDIIENEKTKGKVFFALSPFWLSNEKFGNLNVGLKDEDVLSEKTLSHLMLNACLDLSIYQSTTYQDYYQKLLNIIDINSTELELMSIWSPSYLINILNDLPNNKLKHNKNLKISCWTHGFAKNELKELKELLPLAKIIPKGLFLTEGLITYPQKIQNEYLFLESECNFIEYYQEDNNQVFLREELREGEKYEVILTNNNGLYRYNTKDIVLYKNNSLEFIARANLSNDFSGEKLSEEFLENSKLDFFVYPTKNKEYIFFIDELNQNNINELKTYLNTNPHWELAINHKQIKMGVVLMKNLKEKYFNYFIKNNQTISTIKKHHLFKNEELFEYLKGQK